MIGWFKMKPCPHWDAEKNKRFQFILIEAETGGLHGGMAAKLLDAETKILIEPANRIGAEMLARPATPAERKRFLCARCGERPPIRAIIGNDDKILAEAATVCEPCVVATGHVVSMRTEPRRQDQEDSVTMSLAACACGWQHRAPFNRDGYAIQDRAVHEHWRQVVTGSGKPAEPPAGSPAAALALFAAMKPGRRPSGRGRRLR